MPAERTIIGGGCPAPWHHLAVALEENMVVGFASAVHDVHPDKPQELWINEVGVSERHRHKGLAKQILSALLEVGRQFGCTRALVLTDRGNAPAMRLYESLGAEATEQVMFTIHL